jgi:hypothetical protein
MPQFDCARRARTALLIALGSMVPVIASCGSGAGGESVGTAGEVPILTGTHTLILVLGEFNFVSNGVVTNGGLFPATTIVFDTQGTLVSVNSRVASSVTMGGNDGVVAWGTYSDPSNSGQLAHFVAGPPAPSSDLNLLAGTTGNYTLIGSTALTNPAKQTIGTLNSATLAVNFGTSAATVGMIWTIAGVPFSTTLTGVVGQPLHGSCGSNCTVEADLAWLGPNASRAGMAYGIFGTSFSGIGAAAFAKN